MSLTFFIHLPMKMEPIRCSETSAIKTQTTGNYQKRNILQLKHDESLKTISSAQYNAVQPVKFYRPSDEDLIPILPVSAAGSSETTVILY